jgi:hypothetical protein
MSFEDTSCKDADVAALADHATDARAIAAALVGFRTEPIAAVRERATVRVLGQVEAMGPVLVAPASGRPCVAYDIAFFHGRVVHRERSTALFAIVDPAGDRAVVDPTHAEVRIVDRTATIRIDAELSPELVAIAVARDAEWERAEEVVITPGDTMVVVAAGMMELDRDDDRRIGSYRGLAPTRLRLGGTPEYPVMLSTHPHDIAESRRQLETRW